MEVLSSLWALAHALEARSKHMHRTIGVTGPQRLVLRAIGDEPGCTPGNVAVRLHLHPGTVSRHVSSLVRSGHVRRGTDRGDGRRQRLQLSPRGLRLNGNDRGTVEEAVRHTLATAPAGDVKAMVRLMASVTEQLAP
ncbi:MAG TPA: MarR family transcriptional regulator [Anaeromyxobacteraceae bacterium]|nr:MarR family transcriptional regulator [Anaeromyxobacteraceae bacterium]